MPLAAALVDVVAAVIETVAEIVVADGGVALQTDAQHIDAEAVASVLVVFAHAEFATVAVGGTASLVEPVFAMNVVSHQFVGLVSRADERETVTLVGLEVERHGPEESLELVVFLTVEIHEEGFGVGRCAETCLAVLGNEFVVVERHVAEKRHLELIGGFQHNVGLIVEILWVVFALGVGAAEKRGIALVTHTMEHGKLFSGSAERQTSALHTCGKCALKCLWFLVGDIEYRRHFVAVFGVETTCAERHRAHHIGVDDAEALLLARTHQLWAMHLYAVDIHAVLVVATATHHVLRTHLILGTNASLCGDNGLHTVARRRRRHVHRLNVDTLQRVGLLFKFRDLHTLQFNG